MEEMAKIPCASCGGHNLYTEDTSTEIPLCIHHLGKRIPPRTPSDRDISAFAVVSAIQERDGVGTGHDWYVLAGRIPNTSGFRRWCRTALPHVFHFRRMESQAINT